MALLTCKHCGGKVAKTANSCPGCGAAQRRTSLITYVLGVPIILSLGAFIIGVASSNGPKQVESAAPVVETLAEARARRAKAEAEVKARDEAVARGKAFLPKLKAEKDEMKDVTFYTHKKDPTLRNHVAVYIVKPKSGDPGLRIKFFYTGEDWLFVERFIVKADEQKFELNAGHFGVERDNAAGRVWEWVDIPVKQTEHQMLNAITTAKTVTVRFEGKQYYRDLKLKAADVERISEVIAASAAL